MIETIFWGAFGGIACAWIIQGCFNMLEERAERKQFAIDMVVMDKEIAEENDARRERYETEMATW